jgi:hypothetical protein
MTAVLGNPAILAGLGDQEKQRLRKDAKEAQDDAAVALYSCYRHIGLAGDGELRTFDLQREAMAAGAKPLSALVWEKLIAAGAVVVSLDPGVILDKAWEKGQDFVSTQSVRQNLLSYPPLPVPASAAVLRRGLQAGIRQGAFGYAEAEKPEDIKPEALRFGETVAPDSIKIAPTAWLVSAEKCKALRPEAKPVEEEEKKEEERPPEGTELVSVGLTTGTEAAQEVAKQLQLLVDQGTETLGAIVVEAEGDQALAALSQLVTQVRLDAKVQLSLRAEVTVRAEGDKRIPASSLDKARRVMQGYKNVRFGARGKA